MERLSRKENPVFLVWKVLWAFGFTTGLLALVIGFFSLNTGLTGLTPPLIYALIAFGAALFTPLYTLPAFLAFRARLAGRRALLICNLLLGWTVLGWIGCLIYIWKKEVSGDGAYRQ